MLKVLIKHSSGNIIFSKDSDWLIESIDLIKENQDIVVLNNKRGRWLYYNSSPFELFVFSDSQAHIKQQRVVFESDISPYIEMLRNLNNFSCKVQEQIDVKFKRFTHNIKESNARNIQLLEDTVWLEISDKRFKETLEIILNESSWKEKIKKALLNFKKDSDDIRNEMKAFKLLNSDNPAAELRQDKMPIHWVVLGIVNVFFYEFQARDIYINIGEAYDMIELDYSSVSVILHHILDNALKYCKSNSAININFSHTNNALEIEFQMVSLELHEVELNKIFNDGFSWDNAKKLWKAWSWIGMYIIHEICRINSIRVVFIPWEFDSCDQSSKDIRYAFNVLKLTFPVQ